MKKPKTTVPYCFKEQSHQEMVDYLNTEYPISLKHNEDLVNRVHARYPLIEKSEVGIIIRAIFASIRDLLILGKILNFHNLFFDTKLLVFTHRKSETIFPAVKVQVSTPPRMRKNEK